MHTRKLVSTRSGSWTGALHTTVGILGTVALRPARPCLVHSTAAGGCGLSPWRMPAMAAALLVHACDKACGDPPFKIPRPKPLPGAHRTSSCSHACAPAPPAARSPCPPAAPRGQAASEERAHCKQPARRHMRACKCSATRAEQCPCNALRSKFKQGWRLQCRPDAPAHRRDCQCRIGLGVGRPHTPTRPLLTAASQALVQPCSAVPAAASVGRPPCRRSRAGRTGSSPRSAAARWPPAPRHSPR